MESKEIKKKISLALEVVDEMPDKELKAVAFGVVLKLLLVESLPDQNKAHAPKEEPIKNDAILGLSSVVKTSPVLSSLPITQDELSLIYRVDGDELKLQVQIKESKNSEQQRKLAQVMLFGYKAILDVKELSGSKLLSVAKEWDIPTDHFVKNVKSSKYLQVRNVGTGKDPIFSLKPGALNQLAEEVKALSNSNL